MNYVQVPTNEEYDSKVITKHRYSYIKWIVLGFIFILFLVDKIINDEDCWEKDAFSFIKEEDIERLFLNISRRTCLHAITNFGDESRFLPLIKKLSNKECVHFTFFGGSISCGVMSNPYPNSSWFSPETAYPKHLTSILNSRFPCDNAHKISNLCQNAIASDTHYNIIRNQDTQKIAHNKKQYP